MSNNQDDNRRNEIAFAMDLIQNICLDTKIGLVPYERKDGTLMVVIQDATSGKQYVLIKNKED